ncbi:MAG TPA: glycoside hydrolase family 16 protein [Balneolaceae bacterium]|nr:glycoside hydrolase family 16 protein [Balneolaceae bacterium]
MRSITALFTLLIFISCGTGRKTATGTENGSGNSEISWELIWEDDFTDMSEPDPEKWGFAGRNRANWGMYCRESPETVFVENNQLVIRSGLNTAESDSVKYQTGCINTKDKFSFRYGKVEVHAKLSAGKGSWPAIWMMPQEAVYGGWPYSGEIDIMEHLNFDTFVYQTLHTEHTYINEQTSTPPNHATAEIDPSSFNTYGIEWFPERIDFFVNGRRSFTYPKLDGADQVQWPFDQSFYLILNQALGGDWVGEILDEDLPVQMVVDWVKVYQQAEDPARN